MNDMKKVCVLLFAALLMLSPRIFAQQNELPAHLIKVWKEADKAAEAKNYPLAERRYTEVVQELEQLPDSINKWMLPNSYYNLACYAARVGKRSKALDIFERFADCVVGKGEVDYPWIQKDPDLESIRGHKRFVAASARLKAWGDYPSILCEAAAYAPCATDSLPQFCYAAPNDRNLVRVREYFNLDSIAGSGNELSKIRNLLQWVHTVVRHDGGSYNPTERNAIAMVELCRKEARGINCRMMAQMLNECYLAMGFKSRFVTCLPRDFVSDCHVINVVYSVTLGKWLWVDPTFNAYVTDENGTMLSIAEVRERIRDGRSYFLNAEANWNGQNKQTKEEYLDRYMAKNLYYLVCQDKSMFNAETFYEGRPKLFFIALAPQGATPARGQCHYVVTDDAWFWRSPYAE